MGRAERDAQQDLRAVSGRAHQAQFAAQGKCTKPTAKRGLPCALSAECDTTPGSGDGVCGLKKIDFTPPQGRPVELGALANDRIVYRVQDTGIGIAPDAQQYVFDEFRQVDGSPTRRYGGSGLGLSLAQRLAHLLGGSIEMASTMGEGSTFAVELPLEYEAPVELPGDA